jgi:hypothetical protein
VQADVSRDIRGARMDTFRAERAAREE